MNQETVLITGAGGFVGKYLIEELKAHNRFIIACDLASTDIQGADATYQIDITKPETYREVLQQHKPDWIIHLAAVSSVGFAIEHPDITRTINVNGTKLLLENAHKVSPHSKFLIISSADIYGNASSDPLQEKSLMECAPTNPYAESKLEMEKMIEEKWNSLCIRVRPFPHVGPFQRRGFVTADFASQIAEIEHSKKGSVLRVGNLAAIRDFTDVRDVVRAYRLLMELGKVGEVYHVASGHGLSIQYVLDELIAHSTVPIKIEQDESKMRPSDNPVLVGNADKIYTQCGWKPEITIQNTLQDVLNYWRKSV